MASFNGCQKLGQPVLLSYFVSEENSGSSQPAQANVPLRLSWLSGLEPGTSVRCRRSTSYCGLVRMRRHSLSLFSISNEPAVAASLSPNQRSATISAAAPAPASRRRRSTMALILFALLLPPQLLEPRVASAIETVELVADRILLVVVLVVLLRLVERSRRHDLGLDRLLEALGDLSLRGLRQRPLLLAMREDRAAVLVAAVAELPILRQRIDVVPQHVDHLLVADLGRVVDDLDRLGMSGAAVRDLLVAGIDAAPADIARGGADHAFDLVEVGFHAPEAAAGEGRLGGGRWRHALRSGARDEAEPQRQRETQPLA